MFRKFILLNLSIASNPLRVEKRIYTFSQLASAVKSMPCTGCGPKKTTKKKTTKKAPAKKTGKKTAAKKTVKKKAAPKKKPAAKKKTAKKK